MFLLKNHLIFSVLYCFIILSFLAIYLPTAAASQYIIMDDDTPITSSKLFSNEKIHIGNPQQEWAKAFYIENGVIKYMGEC
jgi:hypothetical protein